MTPQEFLNVALSFPEAALGRHQGGADVRVGGKIFASPADRLGAEKAVLSLNPLEQELLCETEPEAFEPVKGRAGELGWTYVTVANIDEATARSALAMAWRKCAPPKVAKAHPGV